MQYTPSISPVLIMLEPLLKSLRSSKTTGNFVTCKNIDSIIIREGPLIPDAFRCFRDLLISTCESSKCYIFLRTPGFLLDDAVQL